MSAQRVITRRFKVEVEFHQVDMMQVVHNSAHFRWFEKGRFQIMENVFSMAWAIENRIATPVVMNHCEYLSPATYGDTLVVTTRHRIAPRWEGRFQFQHSISNSRTKREICEGESAITVFDMSTRTPVKEIHPEIWSRYQAIR